MNTKTNINGHFALLSCIMAQMPALFEKWGMTHKEVQESTLTTYDGFYVVEVGSADSPTWDQETRNLSHNNVRQFGFNLNGVLKWQAHAFWTQAEGKSEERLSSNRAWALRFTRNYIRNEVSP